MISPELLRRFDFFAGFSDDYLKTLALIASTQEYPEGHQFFGEDEIINTFHLIIDGKVGITLGVPDQSARHGVASQLLGTIETEDVVVSTEVRGEVFGWSALLPPFQSTAGAVALSDCEVLEIDGPALRSEMEADPTFGFLITQRLAQVIHERLGDRQIECILGAVITSGPSVRL